MIEQPSPAGHQPATDAVRRELATELDLRHRVRNGASWFYWIAAATVVNAILFYTGTNISFPIGALLSFFVEGLFKGLGLPTGSGLIGHIAVAGGLAYIGRRASAGSTGAFVTGGVLYAADTLLGLVAPDVLFFLLHALGLWGIWTGWSASRRLAAAKASAAS